MRGIVILVIVGSIFAALLALVGTTQQREDDLGRSITQMVKTTR